jgi:PAT family beta-lactamase induction signal transducer AmpG
VAKLSLDSWATIALAALLVLVPWSSLPTGFWAAFPGSLLDYSPFAQVDGLEEQPLTRWILQSRGWVALAAIGLCAAAWLGRGRRANEMAFYASLCALYAVGVWPFITAVFEVENNPFASSYAWPDWLVPAACAAVALLLIGVASRKAASLAPETGLASVSVYFEHRPLVMLALGFAAGLPNLLVFDTLSAWLRTAGVSLQVIGFFALATLSYSLKFLWAPLVDRTHVPVLSALLGHRRSWMLVCQGAIIVGLWLISGSNPTVNLGLVALFAVFVAFTSATQDIVIDAWRIEATGQERQGAMAAAYQWGYRIAILTAGIAPLFIASRVNWGVAYATMAVLMAIGVLAVLLAPKENARPKQEPLMPTDMPAKPAEEAAEWALRLLMLVIGAIVFGAGFTGQFDLMKNTLGVFGAAGALAPLEAAWAARPLGVFIQVGFALAGLALIISTALPAPGRATRPGVYFKRSYGEPLADFFKRFEGTAVLILAMICCYRLSDFVLNIMNPFYLDVGFDLERIGEVRKGFGVIMLSIGVAVAGWAVARFGLMKSLIGGAIAGPASNLMFAWLATTGPDWRAFAGAIAVDNITAGFCGTVLIAYMSSLTSAGFTATQYALFSSLYALPGKLIAAQSGAIIEASARASQAGGPIEGLQSLFGELPDGSFVRAADIGVSPAALGAGYVMFFFYSCLIGVLALVLALMIARKQGQGKDASPAPAPA